MDARDGRVGFPLRESPRDPADPDAAGGTSALEKPQSRFDAIRHGRLLATRSGLPNHHVYGPFPRVARNLSYADEFIKAGQISLYAGQISFNAGSHIRRCEIPIDSLQLLLNERSFSIMCGP